MDYIELEKSQNQFLLNFNIMFIFDAYKCIIIHIWLKINVSIYKKSYRIQKRIYTYKKKLTCFCRTSTYGKCDNIISYFNV